MSIRHARHCSPHYPEKAKGEAPQATTDVALSRGEVARTCNDCGAFEIVRIATVGGGRVEP